MGNFLQLIKNRWVAKMPKLYKWVFRTSAAVSVGIGGYVGVIQTYGQTTPEWLIGVLGVTTALTLISKMTKEGTPSETPNVTPTPPPVVDPNTPNNP